MSMITQNWMELVPAYGRDYKTQKDVKVAFLSGKDFNGDYTIKFQLCSIRNFAPGTKVLLRYKKHTRGCTFTVPATE